MISSKIDCFELSNSNKCQKLFCVHNLDPIKNKNIPSKTIGWKVD
jgi:hypothetical protein